MIFGDFGLHVITLGHHFDSTELIFRRPFLVPIFRSEKKTQKTSLCGLWQLYADFGELYAEGRRNVRRRSGGLGG